MTAINQDLLSRLLDNHGAALVLYAQQWCDDPEDIVQEAFLRLARQKPIPDNVIGWLYRVVRNLAVSASRTAGRRGRHELAAARHRVPWFDPVGEDTIDTKSAVEALESVPIEQREVIVLRIWSGLSFDEIGVLLGKSTSTAHRWYEKGLTTLREKWSIKSPDVETPQ